MASLGRISVGMSLDATQFDRGLAYVRSDIRTLAGDVDRLGGMLRSTLGGVAVVSTFKQIGSAIFSMSKEAAHAEDAIASFSVIFGREASEMVAYSNQMASKFNVGVNSILDAEGRIGSVFQGAGLAPSKVAAYTKQIAQLAIDYRALKGVELNSAFDKFSSGLAGEAEPLRALGIFLTEAQVKAEALRLGLGKLNGELTEGEKIQARFSLITQQGAVALGSAVREIDSAAAKIEALSGAFDNLRIAIGKATAPAVGKGSGWLADFLGKATTGIKIMTGQMDDQLKILNGGPKAVLGAVGNKAAGGVFNAFDRRKEEKKIQAQARFDALKKDPWKFIGDSIKPKPGMVGDTLAVGVGKQIAGAIGFGLGTVAPKVAPAVKAVASMFTGGKAEPHATGFTGIARRGSREAESTVLRTRYSGSKDPVVANTKKTADQAVLIVKAVNNVADNLKLLKNGTALIEI